MAAHGWWSSIIRWMHPTNQSRWMAHPSFVGWDVHSVAAHHSIQCLVCSFLWCSKSLPLPSRPPILWEWKEGVGVGVRDDWIECISFQAAYIVLLMYACIVCSPLVQWVSFVSELRWHFRWMKTDGATLFIGCEWSPLMVDSLSCHHYCVCWESVAHLFKSFE